MRTQIKRLFGGALARAARPVVGGAGYVLWKRDVMRFGCDPWLDVSRLARAWGRPVGTIFDVGANDGGTLREVLPAFPEATVHAFEPHPRTFERLAEREGREPRARLHRLALADKVGRLPFHEYGTEGAGSLMNSLTDDAGFPRLKGYAARRIEVDVDTIDAFCDRAQISAIDLLKIDVEGLDLAVIRGARRLLAEGRIGFIFAEFNDLLERPGVTGGALVPIAQFLEPFGLRYVATYTDRVEYPGPHWVSANVLFARPGA